MTLPPLLITDGSMTCQAPSNRLAALTDQLLPCQLLLENSCQHVLLAADPPPLHRRITRLCPVPTPKRHPTALGRGHICTLHGPQPAFVPMGATFSHFGVPRGCGSCVSPTFCHPSGEVPRHSLVTRQLSPCCVLILVGDIGALWGLFRGVIGEHFALSQNT